MNKRVDGDAETGVPAPSHGKGVTRAAHRLWRNPVWMEFLRVGIQVTCLGACCMSIALVMVGAVIGERPANVPWRLCFDTFGEWPLAMAMNRTAPLLERARYERPGNAWRPLIFPPSSIIGWGQDLVFSMWNFGVAMAWSASWLLKGCAVMFGFFAWIPALIFVTLFLQGIAVWIFTHAMRSPCGRPVIRVYLVWLPEELLILNQLIFARDTFGRVLSPATAELLRLGEQPDADDCVGDDVPQLSEGLNLAQRPNGPRGGHAQD
mmetsp:Transcript_4538/g.5718  ORF Transcript_4538/g.5718 Transcript_4538/m.5718 type:complete len:264 (+) Transcript_4538:36-827(+)